MFLLFRKIFCDLDCLTGEQIWKVWLWLNDECLCCHSCWSTSPAVYRSVCFKLYLFKNKNLYRIKMVVSKMFLALYFSAHLLKWHYTFCFVFLSLSKLEYQSLPNSYDWALKSLTISLWSYWNLLATYNEKNMFTF